MMGHTEYLGPDVGFVVVNWHTNTHLWQVIAASASSALCFIQHAFQRVRRWWKPPFQGSIRGHRRLIKFVAFQLRWGVKVGRALISVSSSEGLKVIFCSIIPVYIPIYNCLEMKQSESLCANIHVYMICIEKFKTHTHKHTPLRSLWHQAFCLTLQCGHAGKV